MDCTLFLKYRYVLTQKRIILAIFIDIVALTNIIYAIVQKWRFQKMSADFPNLTGTEKQIAAAEKVRQQWLPLIIEYYDGLAAGEMLFGAREDGKRKYTLAKEWYMNQTQAYWWQNLKKPDKKVLEQTAETCYTKDKMHRFADYVTGSDTEVTGYQLAKKRMYRRSQPIVVEVKPEGVYIQGDIGRMKDKKEIVREAKFRYRNGQYAYFVDECTPTSEDVAARIIDRFLTAGIDVYCNSQEALEKAESHQYETVKEQWVTTIERQNGTVFCIHVGYGNLEYKEKLRACDYVRFDYHAKGYLANRYLSKEVRAFAEENGFQLTESAQAIIEKEADRPGSLWERYVEDYPEEESDLFSDTAKEAIVKGFQIQ